MITIRYQCEQLKEMFKNCACESAGVTRTCSFGESDLFRLAFASVPEHDKMSNSFTITTLRAVIVDKEKQ